MFAFATALKSSLAVKVLLISFSTLAYAQQDAAPPPNWSFSCSQQNEQCQAIAISRMENGSEMMRMWSEKGPDDVPFLGVIVPLGLHIPSGVILSFDEGQTIHTQMRLINCKSNGCLAVSALSPELELEMRRSKEVAVVIRDSDSRTDLALRMPLWGFSTSLDALRNQ